jgi:hypothetical protein
LQGSYFLVAAGVVRWIAQIKAGLAVHLLSVFACAASVSGTNNVKKSAAADSRHLGNKKAGRSPLSGEESVSD